MIDLLRNVGRRPESWADFLDRAGRRKNLLCEIRPEAPEKIVPTNEIRTMNSRASRDGSPPWRTECLDVVHMNFKEPTEEKSLLTDQHPNTNISAVARVAWEQDRSGK
jgi:hypothetical protein